MTKITSVNKRSNFIAHLLTNMGWFDSFIDGLCIASENEIIEYCNPAFARIFDFDDIEEAIGKNLMNFMDDDAKAIVKAQTILRKENESTKYDLSIITTKGNKKTILISVSPIFDDVNCYSGTLAHLIDITEQKRVETDLKESEQKLSAIINNVGVGIALISPNMEILSLNKTMREWYTSIVAEKKPICYEAFNSPPRNTICENCPTALMLKDGLSHKSIIETRVGDMIMYIG